MCQWRYNAKHQQSRQFRRQWRFYKCSPWLSGGRARCCAVEGAGDSKVQKAVKDAQAQYTGKVVCGAIHVARSPRHTSTRWRVCSRIETLGQLIDDLTYDHNSTSTAKARAGALMTPPPCMGGVTHGWVPVDTHTTPVLPKGRRLWVAHSIEAHTKITSTPYHRQRRRVAFCFHANHSGDEVKVC